jgi:hypothetical protein
MYGSKNLKKQMKDILKSANLLEISNEIADSNILD